MPGQTRELWLRSDGLPVRWILTNESATPSLAGDVHYRESLELRSSPSSLGRAPELPEQAEGRCSMVDGGGSCVAAMAHGTGALAGSHVHFRSDRLTNRLPRRAPLEYSRSASASCSTASSTSAERPHEVLSATNGLSNRTPFRARVDMPSIRPIKRAHWKNPVRARQLGPPDGATLAWRRYSTTGAERKANVWARTQQHDARSLARRPRPRMCACAGSAAPCSNAGLVSSNSATPTSLPRRGRTR
jgi:hypothetical protein